MLNRWIEHDDLLDTLEEVGAGCIAFSPLAQGLLTDRYLGGVPADSRVATGGVADGATCSPSSSWPRVRALNEIAARRGQTLAAAGAGLGAARPADDRRWSSARAASRSSRRTSPRWTNLELTDDELAEIDRHALESGIDLWAASSAEQ